MLKFLKSAWQGIRNKVTPYSIGILATAVSVSIGAYYTIPGVVLSVAGIVGAVMWYGGEKNKEVAEKLVGLIDRNRDMKTTLRNDETGRVLLEENIRELTSKMQRNEPTSTIKINKALNIVSAGLLATGTVLTYCYKNENENFGEGSFWDEFGALMAGTSMIGAGINHVYAASRLRDYTDDLENIEKHLRRFIKIQSDSAVIRPVRQELEQKEQTLEEQQQELIQLREQLQQTQEKLVYAEQMKNNFRILLNITKQHTDNPSKNVPMDELKYSSHNLTM